MNNITLNSKHQWRRDTAANWSLKNPIVAEAEPAYEIDSRRFKIGDGVTSWNELEYISSSTILSTPLGSIEWMLTNNLPDGYEALWDGHYISRAQYPDFFSQLVDTNKLPFVTASTYTSQLSTYSSCASFVKIDGNQIRLPTIRTFMKAGSTAGTLGNDQIVNITGSMYYVAHGSAVNSQCGGAFAVTQDSPYKGNGTGAGPVDNYSFDASRCVRVGSEVQPKFFAARPFMKCADVSRTLAEEQTSEIRDICANKANVDLLNVSLSKYLSGNGYYKAPDGLLIQWGVANGGKTTIYFPTNFYSVFSYTATSYYNASDNTLTSTMWSNLTTSSASIKTVWLNAAGSGWVTDGSEKVYWIAVGSWK